LKLKCPACNYDLDKTKSFSYTPSTIDKLPVFDNLKIICCGNCEFGMIEEDIDEELLSKYYSSDYSGKAKKNATSASLNTKTIYSADTRAISQIALIKNFIDLNDNIKILEIGAGAGGFLHTLRSMRINAKYISFEPQVDAHANLVEMGASIENKNFSFLEASKYAGEIDLVVMSHSLEHFNPGKIKKILQGVEIVLKHNGLFFCEVPNANLLRYPNAGEMIVPHLSFFSIDSIKSFLRDFSLEIKFINTCGDFQSRKDHKKQLANLKDQGWFEFYKDNDILRNVRYQKYLKEQNKKFRRINIFISIIIKMFGKSGFIFIINLYRKIKQESFNSLMSSKLFSYSEEREFIRFIAKK